MFFSFKFLFAIPDNIKNIYYYFIKTGLILSISWFIYRFIAYITILIERRISDNIHDPAETWKIRGIKTQTITIRRIFAVITLTIALALILMQFEFVKKIGVSILASAGVLGIIISFAAQKSLSSIFYGIQLALTQPLRIGDTVIINGEWGQIEEIHLTYVVVKIWELRRLIVPIGFVA